jgi:type III secretory pathway component EscR
MSILEGKKTYITGGIMIVLYVLQNILGIQVPTIDASGNLLLNGLAIIFGRSAIASVVEKAGM